MSHFAFLISITSVTQAAFPYPRARLGRFARQWVEPQHSCEACRPGDPPSLFERLRSLDAAGDMDRIVVSRIFAGAGRRGTTM